MIGKVCLYEKKSEYIPIFAILARSTQQHTTKGVATCLPKSNLNIWIPSPPCGDVPFLFPILDSALTPTNPFPKVEHNISRVYIKAFFIFCTIIIIKTMKSLKINITINSHIFSIIFNKEKFIKNLPE